MHFEIEKMERKNDIYKLMSQTIIPRPIAWIVTEDEGVVNIAPFSYFTGLSSEPASVIVSIGHKSDGTPKDTLFNLRKHKKCTICMVEESALEAMHFSSKTLPHTESESDIFHIEVDTVHPDYPPMVAAAPVAYFCELNQEIDLGGGTTVPVILNIDKIYVRDDVIADKENLTLTFSPVARIGKSYAFLGKEIAPPSIP
ncbi:Nitrilotriacetate monooxygenase component B [hydrothermal vent metagenome]|uniref:Nitrilotriacetate monooxygenase component B n=1 Tax=hydrothermal vent metagenome TaxID=652676 RepID=A0A1W1EA34_9ZZZZ